MISILTEWPRWIYARCRNGVVQIDTFILFAQAEFILLCLYSAHSLSASCFSYYSEKLRDEVIFETFLIVLDNRNSRHFDVLKIALYRQIEFIRKVVVLYQEVIEQEIKCLIFWCLITWGVICRWWSGTGSGLSPTSSFFNVNYHSCIASYLLVADAWVLR